QTVSQGTGITVSQTGQDFQVAVVNPVIAMGKVDSAATAENITGLVIGVDRNSTGNYTVNLDPGLTDNYIIQLTADSSSFRLIQATNQATTTFDVLIFDQTGTNQDSDWYFTVIRF
ncbi:MAG: hypothetical protein R2819_15085, partial [Allomuricauda sp.]